MSKFIIRLIGTHTDRLAAIDLDEGQATHRNHKGQDFRLEA